METSSDREYVHNDPTRKFMTSEEDGQIPAPDLELLDSIAVTLRNGSHDQPFRSANVGTEPSLSRAHLKQFESTLRKSDEYHHRVLTGTLLAGQMPPGPPTLRARVGAVLVRLVQRSIFWFTQQVQDFQKATADRIKEHADLLRGQRSELTELRERVGELDQTTKHLSEALSQLATAVAESSLRVHQIVEEGGKTSNAVNELGHKLDTVTKSIETGQSAALRVDRLAAAIREVERFARQTRTELSLQQRQTSIALERAQRRASTPTESEIASGLERRCDPIQDSLYLQFENLFRGAREEIKDRFSVYLPILKERGLGVAESPVLDLGCGRGEWLELLRDQGLTATGVDANSAMIAECEKYGLPAQLHDLIVHLRTLHDGSVGVVTSFHVIEHLDFPSLMSMIDEIIRILKPGGAVILETPNPSNLLVSSQTFYLDPTHRNPLPASLVKFLLEARGLCEIEVLPLHPYPTSHHLPEDGHPATQLLNNLLYGCQDYAVIGRKP
jgi:O-antigen chain-terminating methyltransferase